MKTMQICLCTAANLTSEAPYRVGIYLMVALDCNSQKVCSVLGAVPKYRRLLLGVPSICVPLDLNIVAIENLFALLHPADAFDRGLLFCCPQHSQLSLNLCLSFTSGSQNQRIQLLLLARYPRATFLTLFALYTEVTSLVIPCLSTLQHSSCALSLHSASVPRRAIAIDEDGWN